MRIGSYEIEGELARGGQGSVLRARDPSGAPVALKLLVGTTAEGRARFERERRLLASLGPADGFVPLLDAGDSPEGAWLVMPLLTGGTLRDKLQRGPLGIEAAIALGRALARALGRAHALGIVHRDVKPENVLFDAHGTPLIADLGLAKHFRNEAPGTSQSLSRSGTFSGTVAYVAPEQIEDAKSAGPRADVFALGAVLFECLAGEPAFTGASSIEVLSRIMQGSHSALRSRRPEVPAWLERTVDRALASDPRERFADGLDLARALETRTARAGRGPLVAASVGAGLVAVVLAGFLALPRAPGPGPAPTPQPSATPTSSPTPAADRVEESIRTAWWKPTAEQVAHARATKQPVWCEHEKLGKLVLIPPGKFVMGSPVGEKLHQKSEKQHEVTLTKGFYLGATEVTNEQYRRWKPDHTSVAFEGRDLNGAKQPVVNVSWGDVKGLADWAESEDPGCGARLPTEAEWEYACRAGTTAARYWGEDETVGGQYANVYDRTGKAAAFLRFNWAPMDTDDGYAVTAPVGTFRPNAFGLFDTIGNVWEWCMDWYELYGGGPETDPVGPSARPRNGARVMRGGAWESQLVFSRAARRSPLAPEYRGDYCIGVRLAFSRGSARARNH